MKPSSLRLLFLLPFPPRLDADHGGGRTTAQLLAHLSTHHRIALVYLRAPAEPPLDPVLRERCDLVEEVVRPNPGFSLKEGWTRISSLIRGRPLWVAGCSVAAYHSKLRTIAHSWRPDVVQIEYHVMAQYTSALDRCPAPRILTEHEPGVSAARDAWLSDRGLFRARRYLYMLAWERFERVISRQVQTIVVFSERDRQALAGLAQSTPIATIPFGTVIPEQPLNPYGGEPQCLLFVGNYIHPPNVDAAVRLVSRIFPQVQAHFPEVDLYIIGDNLPSHMRSMKALKHVIITGRVPEVTPFLDHASVVVMPIRMGGGMRVKALEAMVAGKAVVASRLAVEGLNIVDGTHVVLAESDQEFAKAIVQLLSDSAKRASLAVSARSWACDNLGWDKAIEAYNQLYHRLTTAQR